MAIRSIVHLAKILEKRPHQAAAKAAGKSWGGSEKGRLLKVTPEQLKAILKMKAEGEKIAHIARTCSLSRLTIYRVLSRHEEGLIG